MTRAKGLVALITGGAQGIGAELGAELMRRGYRVALVDIDADALASTVAGLGDGAVGLHADVTDLAAMEDAVAQAVSELGRLDVVVANAGIASYGSVAVVDPATFRRVIDVNVTGVFHTVRAALPHLVEHRGYVLVVSSLAAFAAGPGIAAYNASKAGAEHFANTLRLEVAQHGVAVGSAHMAWIDTPLVREAKADLPAFASMLDSLHGPLGVTLPVQQCATALADGVERRARHVFVPAWIAVVRHLRTALTSRLGERIAARQTRRALGALDAQVRALGRSTSARTDEFRNGRGST